MRRQEVVHVLPSMQPTQRRIPVAVSREFDWSCRVEERSAAVQGHRFASSEYFTTA